LTGQNIFGAARKISAAMPKENYENLRSSGIEMIINDLHLHLKSLHVT
jgi:hypothetical protein